MLRQDFEAASNQYPHLYNALLCTSDLKHPLAQEWPPVKFPKNFPRYIRPWCGEDEKLLDLLLLWLPT